MGKNKHFGSFFLWDVQNEIPKIAEHGFRFEAQSDARENGFQNPGRDRASQLALKVATDLQNGFQNPGRARASQLAWKVATDFQSVASRIQSEP